MKSKSANIYVIVLGFYLVWRDRIYRQPLSSPHRTTVSLNFYHCQVISALVGQSHPDGASVIEVEEVPELETVACRVDLALYQVTPQQGSLLLLHLSCVQMKVVSIPSPIGMVHTAT